MSGIASILPEHRPRRLPAAEKIDCAEPAHRESADHLLWIGVAGAAFVIAGALQFGVVPRDFLVGGAIAAPFLLIRPLLEAWRRVSREDPEVLPVGVRDGPRWTSRLYRVLARRSSRVANATMWAASLAYASAVGYATAWLGESADLRAAGAALVVGAAAGATLTFYRVRRWERKHGAKLFWVDDEDYSSVPCVRDAPGHERGAI